MSPTGMATTSAMTEVRNVALASTMTPNFLSAKSGVHSRSVRNRHSGTSRKNSIVSKRSTSTIPAVVRMETMPQKASAAWMRRSRRARAAPAPAAAARRGGRSVRGGPGIMGAEYAGPGRGTTTGASMSLPVRGELLLLLLQQVHDGDADLRALAAEQRAGRAGIEALLRELVGVRGERDVTHLADQRGALLQVEGDELLYLGPLGGLLLDVDEERPGE